ncbi:Cbb3-type cytochrome c oxidase subunit CcoP2 [Sinobacterium norvegicum]|uniref:Cbb3-type cytochrome c oxidase subunit n=1 Tax=Sinobacterium norvegicum TaxID=1641715 RepID=A0ABM9ACW4_9GAMM|nr:Cbb3-type cytochrome c oxidase subunit CcoP2 [Sinobacterium norvegicum]
MEMPSFWSGWISILTIITIVLISVILYLCNKDDPETLGKPTSHSYDGIQEYDNPLPSWWVVMYVATIIFAIGYLIAYPGLGNWKGVLGWTQVGQYENEVAKAEEKYGPIYARFAEMSVEEVAKDPEANRMGQRLFADNCALCHGGDARGNHGFPNLTDGVWLYGGSPDEIKTTLTNGRQGAMPAWGQLGDEGIDQVTQYVMSLNGRDVNGDKAAAGADLFQANCALCHTAEGTGNKLFGAPNLTDNIWLYGGSEAQIKQTLRYGRNGHMPAQKDLLNEDKIHLLSGYVYSLSM